jgi:triosephosphate isomerase
MPERRPLLAGNWKMNGSRERARAWAIRAAEVAATVPDRDVALFPPFPLLDVVRAALSERRSSVALGGQACHTEAYGAFTGAVSADLLADAGCRYVLCGHSERRSLFGETDAVVAAAFRAALRAGLVPLLCVGERDEERRTGHARGVVLRQLEAALAVLESPTQEFEVAYEPVWAIGTGVHAKPEQAEEVHGWIRDRVRSYDSKSASRLRILYGGSVNPGNIQGFLDRPGVDGVLVGGQSLDPEAFGRIVRSGTEGAKVPRPPS